MFAFQPEAGRLKHFTILPSAALPALLSAVYEERLACVLFRPSWGGEVEGQLTPLALLGCNTASFKLTHESGVNSSCSLLFIGEQMRDSISSARWTQLTLRLGSHTTPAARLWLGVGAASQVSSVFFAHLKDAALPALLWAAYDEPLACVLFLHCSVLRMHANL